MNRIHLFEFGDQKWVPNVLKHGLTDYLQFVIDKNKIYSPIIPFLTWGIEKSTTKRMIDLCSGSGGGLSSINKEFDRREIQTAIILTDIYPNINAFLLLQKKSSNTIGYIRDPVDARNIPAGLGGFRTMFSSFHHFKPDDAKKILKDAVDKNEPIGIFEFTGRGFWDFFLVMLIQLIMLIITPFIRPMTIGKIFFTYILPLIPLMVMWDAFVSLLRTYSVRELREMTYEIGSKEFNWESGKIPVNRFMNITYLLGYPKQV